MTKILKLVICNAIGSNSYIIGFPSKIGLVMYVLQIGL